MQFYKVGISHPFNNCHTDLVKINKPVFKCFFDCRLTDYVAEDIRQFLIKSLCNARYLLCDGCTVKSTQEVEIVYVRYVDQGEPKQVYLSLPPVQYAHTQGIYEAVEHAFIDHNIQDWKDKLVGIGCDGAAINIGKKNSVATRIKDGAEHVVTIHCVAHGLELAVLDSIKDNRLLEDLKGILRMIYKHYHTSPKAQREVKEIAKALDSKLLKPSKIDGTRYKFHKM